jgi:hypothetical protein
MLETAGPGMRLRPKRTARTVLSAPRKIMETFDRAPNLYCAGSPPAPWHDGTEIEVQARGIEHRQSVNDVRNFMNNN